MPRVSIIVPARNEARNIRDCLQSLQKQTHATFEIILVDDQSTDQTADIVRTVQAEDSRIRFIEIGHLPDGWTGKNHAIQTGFLAAQGHWLLLTDADTHHYPTALAQTLAFVCTEGIDCLSYSPEQDCGSVGELLLQPAVFQLLNQRFSYDRVNDPSDEQAAANGQFILITREALAQIGGYAAVKNKVVEDVEIGRLVKRAGFRLHFGFGKGVVRTRMYRSFQECWRGWSKNLYALLEGRLNTLFAITGSRVGLDLIPVGGAMFFALVPTALAPLVHTGMTLACGLLILSRLLWHANTFKAMGYKAQHAILYPVSSALLLSLLWYSFYRHSVVKQIAWKERQYPSTT